MTYQWMYQTPAEFSNIILSSDGENLTGLWFEGARGSSKHSMNGQERELAIFRETSHWLDRYFHGENPDFIPQYQLTNLTPFRQEVIEIMNRIPFGETVTYNEIAKTIAKRRKLERMSAQAVGGAVGWNPICIIIPCHRVIGAKGKLTGYGGGLQNKIALLAHEKTIGQTISSARRTGKRAHTGRKQNARPIDESQFPAVFGHRAGGTRCLAELYHVSRGCGKKGGDHLL